MLWMSILQAASEQWGEDQGQTTCNNPTHINMHTFHSAVIFLIVTKVKKSFKALCAFDGTGPITLDSPRQQSGTINP
jgi:hypothetical protein